jgi:hypothetical protein
MALIGLIWLGIYQRLVSTLLLLNKTVPIWMVQCNGISARDPAYLLHFFMLAWDLLEQSRLQMPFCTSKKFFTGKF